MVARNGVEEGEEEREEGAVRDCHEQERMAGRKEEGKCS